MVANTNNGRYFEQDRVNTLGIEVWLRTDMQMYYSKENAVKFGQIGVYLGITRNISKINTSLLSLDCSIPAVRL